VRLQASGAQLLDDPARQGCNVPSLACFSIAATMVRSISDSSPGSATPKFSVMTKPDLTDELLALP